MSADQVTQFFVHRDYLIRMSDRSFVLKVGSLLLAPHQPLPEGKGNNEGPISWAVLDRIIHESSAHLKPDHPNIILSGWAQESCVLGGAAHFCIRAT